MTKKILILALLVFSLTFNAVSQEVMSKDIETSMKKEVTPADAAKNALKAGAKVPEFSLLDAEEKNVKSEDLLKEGNLVLVFYRGAWCPYCNLYLRKLQQNLTQIKENGGVLVAVSVEGPDKSMEISQKNKLDFTVLTDKNLDVARQFGIVYQTSKNSELPLAATYIINQKGEIVYAFLETDYKKRAAPEEIIQTLSNIKSPAKMADK